MPHFIIFEGGDILSSTVHFLGIDLCDSKVGGVGASHVKNEVLVNIDGEELYAGTQFNADISNVHT